MLSTTPNKETIRRICHLNGATICYLNIDTGDIYVDILTDIPLSKIIPCESQLKEWTGMNYRVYNFDENNTLIANIKQNGELILPISL